MKYLRLLLFPFSLLYGLLVILRNWCYDAGFFKSREFELPIISVGNLEVGGAGKSPMTEYLVGLFKNDYHLATLSRGYGRKTKGFIVASANSTATEIGDEPAQFKQKFPDITVAVCEKRVVGIEKLEPHHDLVIMDDAFQHRAVKPGFSILMFDYNNCLQPHLLLPAGNLREPMSGRWRANTIVVSKCPPSLTETERETIKTRLRPLDYQQVFFTSIAYQPLKRISNGDGQIAIDGTATVFLLTGIANPAPLLAHLKTTGATIIHHKYPDHHQFTLKNISKLADEFAACPSQNKVIITTEKDARRLDEHDLRPVVKQLPFFVLPIGIIFLNNGQQLFDQSVKNYVREHSKHHTIH